MARRLPKYTNEQRARKGGIARAAKLSARRRSDIASYANLVRWTRVREWRLKNKAVKPLPRDVNQMAADLVRRVEEMGAEISGKNPLAVALGRLGGLKGGRARADRMSEEARHASAVRAARARWDRREE